MDYRALNDSELVLLARCGVVKALILLEKKYHPYIINWVRHFLRKPEYYKLSYEDLRQQALQCFYRSLTRFRDEEGFFYMYLLTSVRNEVYSEVRQTLANNEHRRCLSLDQEISTPEGDTFAAFAESDEILAKPQRLLQLQEGINFMLNHPQLSAIEKTIVEMIVGGYSYKEIADKLGITPKDVDNRYQKVRRILEPYREWFL